MTSHVRRLGRRQCVSGALFLITSLAGPTAVPPATSEWAGKWQEDLRFLAQRLPETHPNAFHAMERRRFEEEIRQLSDRAPSLSHPELVFGLARIVAGIGDGHTRLTLSVAGADDLFTGHSPTDQPRDPALVFHAYPIRLHWYSDGLHVQRIASAHAASAGARVLAIGRTRVEDAIAKISPAVSADNEMQRKDLIPQRLVVAELLAASGILERPGPADFHLQTRDGKRLTIRLSPAGPGPVSWADARLAGAPVPQSAKRREEAFWFEVVPEDRAVYFQYNMVADAPRETLARFSERLSSALDEGPADTLIIDLRRNRGGNNSLNRALLRALIRNSKLQRTGSLLVLVGRTTFSAAMMFAVDLEKHTPALFVGEPTGASPNGYGDSRKVVLPHTGLTVRISTLYWQYSEPRDKRPWIAPHIPVDVSSQDEIGGRDPVLETALTIARARALNPSPAAGGIWKGRLTFPFEAVDYSIALEPGGGPWSATMTIGHPAFEGAAAESVSVEGRSLSFVLKTSSARFGGSATRAGDWLLGDLLQSDQSIARFALRRAGHSR